MNLEDRLLFTFEEFVGSFELVVSENPKSVPDKLEYGSVVSARCLASWGKSWSSFFKLSALLWRRSYFIKRRINIKNMIQSVYLRAYQIKSFAF